MIVETHAHYDDDAFDQDREEILNSLKASEVGIVVNIGASIKSSKQSMELSKQYDFIYSAIGVHPSEVGEMTEEDFEFLKHHIQDKKVVAVGEIGLDYYWDTPERELQKTWFIRQLHLAIEEEKPVVIHSRDAAADTLAIMKEAFEYAKSLNKPFTGVIHCFSYSYEIAREYQKLGFYIGVGGVVTFKNARVLKEVVQEIPLESIVLETDSPYLSPEPNRGKRNDSTNLTYVVNMIAEIKNVTRQQVIEQTTQNAKKLYQLV